jgi:hypothetical protein
MSLSADLKAAAESLLAAAAKLEAHDAPTIESVYGKPLSELKPPDGYEWSMEDGKAAFRRATANECFLAPVPSWFTVIRHSCGTTEPRLILRQKAKRRYVFEDTGHSHKPAPRRYEDAEAGCTCLACGEVGFEGKILRLVERPDA